MGFAGPACWTETTQSARDKARVLHNNDWMIGLALEPQTPVPAEVSVRPSAWAWAVEKLPVASRPWLFSGSLLFSSVGVGISLLVGVSYLLSTGKWAQSGLLLLNYGVFGGGLALRSFLNRRRQLVRGRQRREMEEARRARQRAELRLTVLQAQVEPHFLFNTLASVRSLVGQDPRRAEATIDALVDYLRAAIPKLRDGEGGAVSTLAAQFAMCESYLKVMKVRMGDRLSYAVVLPEALAQAGFPALMLISLVENAIKHGLEPKPGPGRVELRAESTGAGELRVVVTDNGLGLRPGLGSGMGLVNIREQLTTLYGEHAALELQGAPAGGVMATIRLPERSAP